jgi:hypothetical protein
MGQARGPTFDGREEEGEQWADGRPVLRGKARLRHVGVDEAVQGRRHPPLEPVHAVHMGMTRHELRLRGEPLPGPDLQSGGGRHCECT